MQRRTRSWRVAAIVSIVGWAGVSAAQSPVCAQPEPDQPVYTACLPGGRFLVVPLLTSLAVEQLLTAGSGPITRDAYGLFASMTTAEGLEKNAALAGYLDRLEPLKFTRIDTPTGTLRLDVGEGERKFSAAVTIGDQTHDVGIELPARLEGGYWRTPGVLQIAFWKGQRPSFVAKTIAGTEMSAEVECVAISADGIRVVTTDPSVPDVFVRYDSCE